MKATESVTDFYNRLASQGATNLPVSPTGIGHFNVFSRDSCTAVSPYSRRDFYKASLIIGRGKLYYADKWIQIDRPAMLFSNPVVPYSWEPESAEQAGWYCLFTEEFIQHSERTESLRDSPLFRIGSCPIFFPDECQLKEISAIFQKMITEINSVYPHKYDVLRSYLHLLIHEAMKSNPAQDFGAYTNASERVAGLFMELLERQFPVDSPATGLKLKSPVDYARALSVHINHLNRSVKEVTGKTTTKHIAARITKEARALLLHTDWNISDIAYGLGFEYPSYFTNFFRKHTGLSPNGLRTGNV
ncbi:AraC family transcriptional activator of pobA [Pedobacter africanus]|uniref:AraC-like DNA-binding protein n=1 Tax=Pedobacter africanus TaxID=151894 RepID=A0ACC6KXN8_9SPHI|nr:helix-turn-helix domain-containing protein [Pedobacter africanus]MDR6783907.1 AraC-like DNA-binding protein [Pedobacter africanus]